MPPVLPATIQFALSRTQARESRPASSLGLDTIWDAIQSAIRDVTTVAGVRVVDVRDSMDALAGNRTQHSLT